MNDEGGGHDRDARESEGRTPPTRRPAGESSPAGLVLGGGGARGAYAVGALSVLLPRVKAEIRILTGTSAGAISSAYLAANWQRPADELMDDASRLWGDVRLRQVLAPLVGPGGAARFLRYVTEFLPVPGSRTAGMFNSEPLRRTVGDLVDFEALHANVQAGRLRALGLAATSAYANRSVVFHSGGSPPRDKDRLRGIEYVATPRLATPHVLASAAIPALFPAVHVDDPPRAAGWYYDGAPRLNTPIKPALWLGAKRVVVIALNAIGSAGSPDFPDGQPDFFVGAAQLLQSALVDPLAQDIRTLATRNVLLAERDAAASAAGVSEPVSPRSDEQLRPVPYIFISPQDPSAIGEIALEIYRKRYGRIWRAGTGRDLWVIGQLLTGGGHALHGELLSYLFFAPEFAQELIRIGRADAQRWIDDHPEDLWRLEPLPEWGEQPFPHAVAA